MQQVKYINGLVYQRPREFITTNQATAKEKKAIFSHGSFLNSICFDSK